MDSTDSGLVGTAGIAAVAAALLPADIQTVRLNFVPEFLAVGMRLLRSSDTEVDIEIEMGLLAAVEGGRVGLDVVLTRSKDVAGSTRESRWSQTTPLQIEMHETTRFILAKRACKMVLMIR